MTEELLIRDSVPFAIDQKIDLLRVNVGQCIASLKLAERGVMLTILKLGPEPGVERSAIRGKHHSYFMHSLHQAAAADGLVVRMGNEDQGIFQQRSQSSHYQSRMVDSM